MASSSNIADVDPEDLYESLPTASSTIHMVAGSMAGILEHCVMYPVDSVKVGTIYVHNLSSQNLSNWNHNEKSVWEFVVFITSTVT